MGVSSSNTLRSFLFIQRFLVQRNVRWWPVFCAVLENARSFTEQHHFRKDRGRPGGPVTRYISVSLLSLFSVSQYKLHKIFEPWSVKGLELARLVRVGNVVGYAAGKPCMWLCQVSFVVFFSHIWSPEEGEGSHSLAPFIFLPHHP